MTQPSSTFCDVRIQGVVESSDATGFTLGFETRSGRLGRAKVAVPPNYVRTFGVGATVRIMGEVVETGVYVPKRLLAEIVTVQDAPSPGHVAAKPVPERRVDAIEPKGTAQLPDPCVAASALVEEDAPLSVSPVPESETVSEAKVPETSTAVGEAPSASPAQALHRPLGGMLFRGAPTTRPGVSVVRLAAPVRVPAAPAAVADLAKPEAISSPVAIATERSTAPVASRPAPNLTAQARPVYQARPAPVASPALPSGPAGFSTSSKVHPVPAREAVAPAVPSVPSRGRGRGSMLDSDGAEEGRPSPGDELARDADPVRQSASGRGFDRGAAAQPAVRMPPRAVERDEAIPW